MSEVPPGFTVCRDPRQLGAFRSPAGPEPYASVQPRNTGQIQNLIKWANKRGQPLVPVSSAEGPRAHGCSVPEKPALIVDMSAMMQVRHIDRDDAIAVIEPGVTFPEFDRQLASYGLRSYKPLLPRRSKSVIASHLEREPITSPRDQWDAADPLATVEMVFGTGEMFRTGTAAASDNLDAQLENGLRQMSSLGPFATDFTRVIMGAQGSLAIVSWASVYCERIPALEKAYFVSSDTLEPLVKLSSRIGWRKLGAQCFIVNALQLALMYENGRDAVLDLARRLPAWTLFVNIAALNYFPEDRIAYETEALEEDCAALGLSPARSQQGLEADAITAMQQDLPHSYYKTRLGTSYEEIFFLSQTDKAVAQVSAFDSVHHQKGSGLPYAVYIQPRVQSSSAHIEFTTFDNGVAVGTPSPFHRAASQALDDAGAFFSRPYGIWKDIAYARDAQIIPHLRRVKAMFDPNSVLNPGKSC